MRKIMFVICLLAMCLNASAQEDNEKERCCKQIIKSTTLFPSATNEAAKSSVPVLTKQIVDAILDRSGLIMTDKQKKHVVEKVGTAFLEKYEENMKQIELEVCMPYIDKHLTQDDINEIDAVTSSADYKEAVNRFVSCSESGILQEALNSALLRQFMHYSFTGKMESIQTTKCPASYRTLFMDFYHQNGIKDMVSSILDAVIRDKKLDLPAAEEKKFRRMMESAMIEGLITAVQSDISEQHLKTLTSLGNTPAGKKLQALKSDLWSHYDVVQSSIQEGLLAWFVHHTPNGIDFDKDAQTYLRKVLKSLDLITEMEKQLTDPDVQSDIEQKKNIYENLLYAHALLMEYPKIYDEMTPKRQEMRDSLKHLQTISGVKDEGLTPKVDIGYTYAFIDFYEKVVAQTNAFLLKQKDNTQEKFEWNVRHKMTAAVTRMLDQLGKGALNENLLHLLGIQATNEANEIAATILKKFYFKENTNNILSQVYMPVFQNAGLTYEEMACLINYYQNRDSKLIMRSLKLFEDAHPFEEFADKRVQDFYVAYKEVCKIPKVPKVGNKIKNFDKYFRIKGSDDVLNAIMMEYIDSIPANDSLAFCNKCRETIFNQRINLFNAFSNKQFNKIPEWISSDTYSHYEAMIAECNAQERSLGNAIMQRFSEYYDSQKDEVDKHIANFVNELRSTFANRRVVHSFSGVGAASINGSDVDVRWVQLWEDGPKFAVYNVGVLDGNVESAGRLYEWGGSRDDVDDYDRGQEPLAGNTDTATKLWGQNWRMPTSDEFSALVANCDVEWQTVNSVAGCRFKGRGAYSNNSIFLPAAGYDQMFEGEMGRYWSSTPDQMVISKLFHFSSENQTVLNDRRKLSCSVRAVYVGE